jgi:hypothetical protein
MHETEKKKAKSFTLFTISKRIFAVLQMIGALRKVSCIFMLCCSPYDEMEKGKFLKFFRNTKPNVEFGSIKRGEKGLKNNLVKKPNDIIEYEEAQIFIRCRVCAACTLKLFFKELLYFSRRSEVKMSSGLGVGLNGEIEGA